VEHCEEEGINTIRALIEEHNNELTRFFERLGFNRSTVINYDKTFNS
jgi:L-amino acid N-acyltransferase YncA